MNGILFHALMQRHKLPRHFRSAFALILALSIFPWSPIVAAARAAGPSAPHEPPAGMTPMQLSALLAEMNRANAAVKPRPTILLGAPIFSAPTTEWKLAAEGFFADFEDPSWLQMLKDHPEKLAPVSAYLSVADMRQKGLSAQAKEEMLNAARSDAKAAVAMRLPKLLAAAFMAEAISGLAVSWGALDEMSRYDFLLKDVYGNEHNQAVSDAISHLNGRILAHVLGTGPESKWNGPEKRSGILPPSPFAGPTHGQRIAAMERDLPGEDQQMIARLRAMMVTLAEGTSGMPPHETVLSNDPVKEDEYSQTATYLNNFMTIIFEMYNYLLRVRALNKVMSNPWTYPEDPTGQVQKDLGSASAVTRILASMTTQFAHLNLEMESIVDPNVLRNVKRMVSALAANLYSSDPFATKESALSTWLGVGAAERSDKGQKIMPLFPLAQYIGLRELLKDGRYKLVHELNYQEVMGETKLVSSKEATTPVGDAYHRRNETFLVEGFLLLEDATAPGSANRIVVDLRGGGVQVVSARANESLIETFFSRLEETARRTNPYKHQVLVLTPDGLAFETNIDQKVGFNDIVVAPDDRQKFYRETVEFMTDHDRIREAAGGAASKSILSAGVPGTGKTMLAKAVIGSLHGKSTFIKLNGAATGSVGMMAWLQKILQEDDMGPFVVLAEDAESLLVSRQPMLGGRMVEPSPAQTTLFDIMSGLGRHMDKILFLVTTNLPFSQIDGATSRRFQVHLVWGPAELSQREDLIRSVFANHLSRLNVEEMARRTEGFVPSLFRDKLLARMVSIANHELVGKPGKIELTMLHFRHAMDEIEDEDRQKSDFAKASVRGDTADRPIGFGQWIDNAEIRERTHPRAIATAPNPQSVMEVYDDLAAVAPPVVAAAPVAPAAVLREADPVIVPSLKPAAASVFSDFAMLMRTIPRAGANVFALLLEPISRESRRILLLAADTSKHESQVQAANEGLVLVASLLMNPNLASDDMASLILKYCASIMQGIERFSITDLSRTWRERCHFAATRVSVDALLLQLDETKHAQPQQGSPAGAGAHSTLH